MRDLSHGPPYLFPLKASFIRVRYNCGDWYVYSIWFFKICFFLQIRGLSVDDAIKKVSFLPQKGAKILKEVRRCQCEDFFKLFLKMLYVHSVHIFEILSSWQCLLEGQKTAVKSYGIEYPSNMWIGKFSEYSVCMNIIIKIVMHS